MNLKIDIPEKSPMQTQKYTFWKYLQLALLLAILFVSNLYLPNLSGLSIVIAFFLGIISFLLDTSPILRISNYSISKTNFLLSSILLTIFSLVYFEIIYSYGFADNTTSLAFMVIIPISYVLGYSIDYSRLPYWPFNLVIITLFLIGGGLTHVFLSVSKVTYGSLSSFLIINRRIPSFWGVDSEPINGPTLDLYNILGTSLLPVILYGKDKKIKLFFYGAVAVISSITFFMALYCSVALQGRTPIIALVTTAVITTIFIIASSHRQNKVLLCLFLALVGLFFLVNIDNILFQFLKYLYHNNILTRFDGMGFETGRYALWKAVINGMLDYPFGGRKIRFTEHTHYAHNVWLDVAYDAGLLPMFLLIFFHALHIKPFFKIFCSELPRLLKVLFMCLGVAVIISFMGTPVIQASIYYFSMSCFFLGLITRLSSDIYITNVQ